MQFRLLIAIAVVIALFIFMRWFMRAPPEKVARSIKKLALYTVVIVLIFLAVTGRLHWLFALIASAFAFLPRLLPLLRYVPLLSRLVAYYKTTHASAGTTQGQQSRVETHYLRMTLDHDSGAMDGEVLSGKFQGRQLSTMTLDELIKLHEECHTYDEQSVSILETYLDRVHGDTWHDQTTSGHSKASDRPPDNGDMTREEAYEILGLSPGASEKEVIDAHRRLMQKLHPDRGGSTFIAAQINKAKDVLLDN